MLSKIRKGDMIKARGHLLWGIVEKTGILLPKTMKIPGYVIRVKCGPHSMIGKTDFIGADDAVKLGGDR